IVIRKRGSMKERSSTKKKITLTVCVVLALFALLNIGWFAWRAVKYAPYSTAMTQNAFSDVIVPRYAFVDDEGYNYNVKYPDYLSFTGNISVGMPASDDNLFTDALIIWPLASGGYEYGVLLYEESEGYQIYIDSQGNAVNRNDDEVIERHKDNIGTLLQRAEEMWSDLAEMR
ncbi:hypothetical protein LJC63_07695, partial [Ruminococcaceae bacterium OttesenSCG-928-L11]|nr:hypothetical protein [Ruminococcaceae bacterium OttesenSCG-928-L11]